MCLHVFLLFTAGAAAVGKYELGLCSILPIYAELVERWRRIAVSVSVLYRHWQRWPGEELLVLGQTAFESLLCSDSMQGN